MPVGASFSTKKQKNKEEATEKSLSTETPIIEENTLQQANIESIKTQVALLKGLQITQIAGLSNETSLINYKVHEAKLKAFDIIKTTLEQDSDAGKFDFPSFITSFQDYLLTNNLNQHSQIEHQYNKLQPTDLKQVIPIALLIPEVITSIAAYGFENQLIGEINVSDFSRKSTRTIKITYNGTSPTGAISQQFSTKIKAMTVLAQQLGVDLQHKTKEDKTTFSITMQKESNKA
jgi:two-component sensor histidine kinase